MQLVFTRPGNRLWNRKKRYIGAREAAVKRALQTAAQAREAG